MQSNNELKIEEEKPYCVLCKTYYAEEYILEEHLVTWHGISVTSIEKTHHGDEIPVPEHLNEKELMNLKEWAKEFHSRRQTSIISLTSKEYDKFAMTHPERRESLPFTLEQKGGSFEERGEWIKKFEEAGGYSPTKPPKEDNNLLKKPNGRLTIDNPNQNSQSTSPSKSKTRQFFENMVPTLVVNKEAKPSNQEYILVLEEGVLTKGFMDKCKYKINKTEQNWNKMSLPRLKDTQLLDSKKASKELINLIRHGIPFKNKRDIWLLVTRTSDYMLSSASEGKFANAFDKTFGDHFPKRHFVVPYFEGKFVPNIYCLKKEGIDAAKRILCLLAHNHPSCSFVPQLPDMVLLFLHFLSEEETYFVCSLSLSNENKLYLFKNKKSFYSFRDAFVHLIKRKLPKVEKSNKKNKFNNI